MSYVEGFLIPVPEGKQEAYRAMAEHCAPIFLEHGATRVVECWGDDVKKGHTTDFFGAVKAEEGEVTVFSWIEYPSKEVRDAATEKVMADPRMKPPEGTEMPFDGKRMIYGGFRTIVDRTA